MSAIDPANYPTAFASGEEAKAFSEILRKQGPWPEGLRRVDFEFGTDSSGSPAVWIIFKVDDADTANDDLLKGIRSISNGMRSEIHKIGSEHWPYVRIEAA